MNESSVQLNDIQQQNMTQNQTIIQQQREIKRLQQKTIDQARVQHNEEQINRQSIESLTAENERMKQAQLAQNALMEAQKREIVELKQRHLIDKQQFAQNMMNEMNHLRNELRRIGQQQQQQLQHIELEE